MKKFRNRIVSGILALTMVASLLPAGILTPAAQAVGLISSIDATVETDGSYTVTVKTNGSVGSWTGAYIVVALDGCTYENDAPSGSVGSGDLSTALTSYTNVEDALRDSFYKGVQNLTGGVGNVTPVENPSTNTYVFKGKTSLDKAKLETAFASAGKTLYGPDGAISGSATELPLVVIFYYSGDMVGDTTKMVAAPEKVPADMVPYPDKVNGGTTLTSSGAAYAVTVKVYNEGDGNGMREPADVNMDSSYPIQYTGNLASDDKGKVSLSLNNNSATEIPDDGKKTWAEYTLTIPKAIHPETTKVPLSGTIKVPYYDGLGTEPDNVKYFEIAVDIPVPGTVGGTQIEVTVIAGGSAVDGITQLTNLTGSDVALLTPSDAGEYVDGDPWTTPRVSAELSGLTITLVDDIYCGIDDAQEIVLDPSKTLASGASANKKIATIAAPAGTAANTTYTGTITLAYGDTGGAWEGGEVPIKVIVHVIAGETPKYTVSFDSHGGSSVASITDVVSGNKITKPSDPTRNGYTFAGWYKDEACTNAWDFSTDTVTSNITLHAKWTEKTYAVTVNVKKDGAAYTGYSNKVWLAKDGTTPTTYVPTAGVAANATTGVAAMGSYAAGTYSIYVGPDASNRVDTNVDVTVSNDAASADVNYYTVTTVADTNAASAYVGTAADPTSGTSAVFLRGATAYLKATPINTYSNDKATWTFAKPTGGAGTTPSAPSSKTNTHSFNVTGTVEATAKYTTVDTYTAKIHLLENGASNTYVTSGVTKVDIATAADGTTEAANMAEDNSTKGLWTATVAASKTYSHAKITVDGATYVVPLTTAIKYTDNEEEDVALYVITLEVNTTTVGGSAAPYGSATVTAGGQDFTAESTTAAPKGTVTFHAPNISNAVTLKSTTPGTNYVDKAATNNWTVTVAGVDANKSTENKFAPSAATTVTAYFTPHGVLAFSPSPITASVRVNYTTREIVSKSADGSSDGYLENVGPGAISGISYMLTKTGITNWTPSSSLRITDMPTSLGKDAGTNGASSGDWGGVKVELITGLDIGVYTADLTISSDDTNVAPLVVPITITVNEGTVAKADKNSFTWDIYNEKVTVNQTPSGTTATWSTKIVLEDIASVTNVAYGATNLTAGTDYTIDNTTPQGTGENMYIPITLTNDGLKKLEGLILPSQSGAITVTARDTDGAVKTANITMTLTEPMPKLASAAFSASTWARGASPLTLTVTDSNSKSNDNLTGEVSYEWSLNGAVQSGWSTISNVSWNNLAVGDVVSVTAVGTGPRWTANHAKSDAAPYTDFYDDTVSKTASFRVVAPEVTVNIKLDDNAYTTPGSGDKITASKTPLGSGVLLDTSTNNAKKYVFVNWTIETSDGGIFGVSGSDTTSTAATSIFTPHKAATVVANWKSIATVEYTKGATAVGPNSKSSGATVNDQYSETLKNVGAKTTTLKSINMAAVAPDGTTDATSSFTFTKTGVASANLAANGTSNAFTVKHNAGTAAGTYTITITTTYANAAPDGATDATVVQKVTYVVPEPTYTITLVATAGGTNRGNYKGTNKSATSGTNQTFTVVKNDSVALTAIANTGYKFVNWTVNPAVADGATADKLSNAATDASNAYGGVTKAATITANFKAITDLAEDHSRTANTVNVGYSGAQDVYLGTVTNSGAKNTSVKYELSGSDDANFTIATPSLTSGIASIGAGAPTASGNVHNVKVQAVTGLGVGTYHVNLVITEQTADAGDTKNGVQTWTIPLTFTVGGGKAEVQVKLNTTNKNKETVTLLAGTSVIATTAPTSGNNYTASGLTIGTAYKVLVNGVDTGVTVTAANAATAANATVQLWTLTTAVDATTNGSVAVSGGTQVTITEGTADTTDDSIGYVNSSSVKISAVPATGKHFTEWTDERSTKNLWTSASNKSTNNPETIAMTADRSVKAHFADNDVKDTYYTVTYKDGSDTLATVSVKKGDSHTIIADPYKAGYIFLYWTKASDTNHYKRGDSTYGSVTVNGDMTFNANWVAEPTWPTIKSGVYGESYESAVLAPSGFTATIAAVTSPASGNYGGLPTGLSLAADGKIKGTPAETGNYEITLKLAKDGKEWTRNYTIFIDKATPSLSGISFSNAANGVKTNALKINGTAKAPLYKPAVWTDPKSYTYTDYVAGTSTTPAEGSLKVTEYEGSATTASTELNFGSDTSKTGKVTFTPSTSAATGATVAHQTSQKYSDIYKSVTVPCTFNLGGKTYDITVAPDRIPTAAGGAYANVDIEVGGTLPTTTAWQFDVSNKGNQPAHVTYTLEGTNAGSFVLTPSYTNKFTGSAANDNDAIDANTTGAVTGVSPDGKEFTVGVASSVSNTTPGVYVAQVRVENYAVNADGSKGALQDTVIVPIRFEVKAATFDASVQIDLYNFTGTSPLTKQKEPRNASVVFKYNSGNASNDVTATWKSDATGNATGNAPGVYTATLNKGTTYHVVVNGFDTGVTISKDATSGTVKLYQVALDVSGNSDVTTAVRTDIKALQVGPGYLAAGESGNVTTPNVYTDNATPKNNFDFATATKWQIQYRGDSSATAGSATANYPSFTMSTGSNAKAVTLTAPYTKRASDQVKISYHSNYDTDTILWEQTVTKGTTPTLSKGEPSRSGYTFVKWNTKANETGTDYDPNATLTAVLNADMDLYAIWEAVSDLALAPATITGTYKHAITNVSPTVTGGSGSVTGYTSASDAFPLYTLAMNATTGVVSGTPNDVGTKKSTVTVTDGAGDTASAVYTVVIGKADVVPDATKTLPTSVTPTDANSDGTLTQDEVKTAITTALGNTQMNGDGTGETKINGTWSVSGTAPTTPGTHSVTVVFTPANKTGETSPRDKDGDHYKTYTTTIPVVIGGKLITDADLDTTKTMVPKAGSGLVFTVPTTNRTLDPNGNTGDPTYTANKTDASGDVYIVNRRWTENGEELASGATAQGGNDYALYITLGTTDKTTWRFDPNGFKDSTIAGRPATVVAINDTMVVLRVNFPKQITIIDVATNTPIHNTTSNLVSVPVSHENEYKITSCKWYESAATPATSGEVGSGATGAEVKFDEKKYYDLVVTVKPKEGMDFSDAIKNLKAGNTMNNCNGMVEDADIARVNNKEPDKEAPLASNKKFVRAEADYDATNNTITIRYRAFQPANQTLIGIRVEGTPGIYYAQTGASSNHYNILNTKATPADNSGNIGSKDEITFNFNYANLSVIPLYQSADKESITVGDPLKSAEYTVTVEGTTTEIPADGFKDQYTHNGTARTDVTDFDNKTLVVTVSGTVDGKPIKSAVAGTLRVQQLRADSIAKNATNNAMPKLRYEPGEKFAVATTGTMQADVTFNADIEGLKNTVTGLTYEAYSALTTNPDSKTYFFEYGENLPTFVAHKNGDPSSLADGLVTSGNWINELKPGATGTAMTAAMGGKTLYMTYVDVNHNVVRVPLGKINMDSEFTTDITDPNGGDPEYGDVLVGTPKQPDGTLDPNPDNYTYVWQYWEPSDTGDNNPEAPDDLANKKGTWKPITTPDGKDRTHVPGKNEVDKYIRVVATDGDTGTSQPSDPVKVEPRSINFDVAPVNKAYDGDEFNDDHKYTSGDFRPTEVKKVYDGSKFVAAAQVFGGPIAGDTIVISPYVNGSNGWNDKVTNDHYANRPQYRDATYPTATVAKSDVGSLIVWPVVLVDTAATDHAIGHTSGYSLTGTDDNGAGKPVYRLVSQDQLYPRGVIMNGGGSVMHVNVDFQNYPTIGGAIPDYPDAEDANADGTGAVAVTDKRETRPGEVLDHDNDAHTAPGEGYPGNEYIAKWYPAAANFDPTNPGTAINASTFDGSAVTVVVKVTPRKGYQYELLEADNSNIKTATKFHFNFGKDVTMELLVDTGGPQGVMKDPNNETYYMWYTFTPDMFVLPPFVSESLDLGLMSTDFIYYAKTESSAGANDHHYDRNTADNDPIPGGMAGIDFTYNLEKVKTAIDTKAGTAAAGTGTILKRTDGSTVTLKAADYGTTWRLKAGRWAGGANYPLDDNTSGTYVGKTFKDIVNLPTKDNEGDSWSYNGLYVYIEVLTSTNDGTAAQVYPVPLAATLTGSSFVLPHSLIVVELEAQSITANGTPTLEYTAGSTFDASGVAGAKVMFDAAIDEYDKASRADAADTQGKAYYFQTWDAVNGFADLRHGDSLSTSDNGKVVYICYTDVNNHIVRQALGALQIKEAQNDDINRIIITYPEPVKDKQPNSKLIPTLWTYDDLTKTDEVKMDQRPLSSGAPLTYGTTWYTAGTTAPTSATAIKNMVKDANKLGATDKFVAGTYYMVEGTIEPKKVTVEGEEKTLAFDTTNGVKVNINGIEVEVGKTMNTRNDGETAVAWAMAEFNEDKTAVIVRYVAKTLDKNLVTAVTINYTMPVATNKAAEYVNYVDQKMVTVTKSADDTTNGTKWYPVTDVDTAAFTYTLGGMMNIGTTPYANGGYYLVENVIKPNKDYVLSESTEVYVDGVLKVAADTNNGVATTSNTDGLRSAKAVFNADGTITIQSIYKVPDFVPGKVNSITITYPEPKEETKPATNRQPAGWTEDPAWTWEYLYNNGQVTVSEAVDGAAPKTQGTTWYKTDLTDADKPFQKADFTPPTDPDKKLSGNFEYDAYYMVEGTITAANTNYAFDNTVYVTINGILVKVGEDTVRAKYDNDGEEIGWAVAVKDGNAIKARYIARTGNAPSTIIWKVQAAVTEPAEGEPIIDTVDVDFARFKNLISDIDAGDATGYVTPSAVKWSVSDTPGGIYDSVASGSKFERGKYYKAEFEISADTASGYTFQDEENDYVAFRINRVLKDGVWGVNDKQEPDEESNGNGIRVKTEKADKNDENPAGNPNKYQITVWFPLTGNLDSTRVIGKVNEPVVNKSISDTDISVDSDEPYQIVEKYWEHWNGTDWVHIVGGSTFTKFIGGDYYRAVMDVELKPGQENFYEFTRKTEGRVDTTKVNGRVSSVDANPTGNNKLPNDTPDRDAPKTTILRKPDDPAAVTTITLAQEYFVAKVETVVHVSARVPEAGVWAYKIEDDIKIVDVSPYDDSNRYDLVPVAGVEDEFYQARWYEAGSSDPMDRKAFEADKTYYLKVTAKMKENVPYIFQEVKTGYKWLDPAVGNNEKANAAVLYTNDPTWQRDKNGDTIVSYVAFEYSIQSKEPDKELAALVTPPKAGAMPDENGREGNLKTNVVGKVHWTTEDGKPVPDGTPFDYSTTYTASVDVTPIDPANFDPTDAVYRINGEALGSDNWKNNGDGTWTLKYSWTTDPKPPEGGGSGGGTPVENPIVYYLLKDQGVTDDPTAEKVRKNGSPKQVPKVRAMAGLVFKGWSEVDPSTLPAGTLPTLVDPTTFKISKDKTFYAVYERGVDHKHYVIGFPNGTFGPDAKITRAEVATIIARSCLEGFVEGGNYGNPGNYNDVSHHWAFSAIAFCAREGVFNGYEDGTFRPDRYITRQELATVVARLAGIQTSQGVPFHDRNQIASWAMNGVYTAYANGWIKGYEDGTFQPERDVNRAETVKIFNGYLKRGVDAKGLEGLKEYIHSGVASNNKEDGNDEYMTWPDVPKTHWAYLEIIEAANDHDYHWQDDEKKLPPEDWDKVYIDEKWHYNDNADDGAEKRDENMSAQKTFTVTYLVSSNGVTYDAITETVDRFASPKPENMPIAVPNEGYRFAGWSSTDPSTGEITLVDPTASGVTADKWFYAVFEEDKPNNLPIYTVTYVIGKNGSYDGATVESVEMFQSPSVPGLPKPVAKKGYRFIGWSETDPADGGYVIMDPTANYVTGDKTFYAVYEKI